MHSEKLFEQDEDDDDNHCAIVKFFITIKTFVKSMKRRLIKNT